MKAIHVAKRELGMEDDDYREILFRETGKRSAGDMTEAERQTVLVAFKGLGFEKTSGGGSASLTGGYARKMQALWLSAYNLGIVRNRNDKAMIAFVDRQTGISHVRWLRNSWDAERAIEAMKKWIAREGGVVWPSSSDPLSQKRAVIIAQRAKLGLPPVDADSIVPPDPKTSLDMVIAALGKRVRDTNPPLAMEQS